MLANIPAVNGPECESLGFNHVVDAYRQFAGPANLAGKRVISSELGAQRNEVYSQTMPELIWDVKRSIVGSINNFVSLCRTVINHPSQDAQLIAHISGLSRIRLLRLVPEHDLAWIFDFRVPFLQHARSTTADLGVLRRLHELDRPHAICRSNGHSEDRSRVLAQEGPILRQSLAVPSQ
jgi:hypothetical protein